MLQTHLIAELLDMEAYDFEGIEQNEKQILLRVRMKRRTQKCPACQTPCDQVHDYRIQRVKDSRFKGNWLFGNTENDDIVVLAAGNGSTKVIIYYQDDTESPIVWLHWGSINYAKSNLEKRLQALSAYPNLPLDDG